MQGIVSQTKMRADQEKVSNNDLSKIARQWDHRIRRELYRFAQRQWPEVRLLGLPIHRYRLRKQFEPGTFMWWVELDIPPFDRYRCEAYRVELSLAGPDQPRLVVRTGIYTYPVAPMSMRELKTVLVRAGADPPLVIRREFGPALDP